MPASLWGRGTRWCGSAAPHPRRAISPSGELPSQFQVMVDTAIETIPYREAACRKLTAAGLWGNILVAAGRTWRSASTRRPSCRPPSSPTRSTSCYSTPRKKTPHPRGYEGGGKQRSNHLTMCLCGVGMSGRGGVGSSFSKTTLLVSTGDATSYDRVQEAFSGAGASCVALDCS